MANESRDVVVIADRLEKREARVIAERQERKRRRKELEAFEKQGNGGNMPTFERAQKANGSMRTGQDGVKRIEDAPLEKLFARRLLDEKDRMVNYKLREAGVRYYRDWYEGEMSSLKAIDTAIKVDGGGIAGGMGLPSTAKAYKHRNDWRRAAQAIINVFSSIDKRLGPRVLQIVDAVVLREDPLLVAGREHSGYSSTQPATAITLDRLRLGLRALAVHYGLMDS